MILNSLQMSTLFMNQFLECPTGDWKKNVNISIRVPLLKKQKLRRPPWEDSNYVLTAGDFKILIL